MCKHVWALNNCSSKLFPDTYFVLDCIIKIHEWKIKTLAFHSVFCHIQHSFTSKIPNVFCFSAHSLRKQLCSSPQTSVIDVSFRTFPFSVTKIQKVTNSSVFFHSVKGHLGSSFSALKASQATTHWLGVSKALHIPGSQISHLWNEDIAWDSHHAAHFAKTITLGKFWSWMRAHVCASNARDRWVLKVRDVGCWPWWHH